MLHALKRLHLWWLRYGEGPSLSRTIQLVGSILAVGAFYLHHLAQAPTVDRVLQAEALDSVAEAADKGGLALAYVFGIIAILVALRSLLLMSIWPWRNLHPGAPIAAPYLLKLPDEPGKDSPYRFHLVDSQSELSPYVSESEYFLGESNRDLDRAARKELYERWLRLSPRSFLYLTRADRACPVALSVILPLTKQGYESLHGLGREKKKVIHFAEDEICRKGPFHYLLIDTFIIAQRQERLVKSEKLIQIGKFQGKRYARTLLLRHLALLWKDKPSHQGAPLAMIGLPNPNSVCIIAETNKGRLVKDIESIGFEKKGLSAIDCPLYELDYPGNELDPARKNLVEALIARIWALKKWKIAMNTVPD